jgi:hypothetical protein
MKTLLILTALIAVPQAFAQGGSTGAARPLVATVAQSGAVSLQDARGRTISRVRAGRYVITVRDRSVSHPFRVANPAGTLRRATGKSFVGVVRWRVTLRRGTYIYSSDSVAPNGSRTLRVI